MAYDVIPDGSRVKIEGKFDYNANRYTYLFGTVQKAERTLRSHDDPAGDIEYTILLDDGRKVIRTSGLVQKVAES